MGFLDGIQAQVRKIVEDKSFGILCLAGGVLLTGFTTDVLWTFLGLGLFLLITFYRRKMVSLVGSS